MDVVLVLMMTVVVVVVDHFVTCKRWGACIAFGPCDGGWRGDDGKTKDTKGYKRRKEERIAMNV